VKDDAVREAVVGMYGYTWKKPPVSAPKRVVVKAVITTLDNLPNNREQLAILLEDPLISEIVFVDQDSRDGAGEWMDSIATSVFKRSPGSWSSSSSRKPASQKKPVIVIHKKNNGAGPGRNAGLDAAGEFDYALMLDGGIRPLRGGTERMLEYLDMHPEADVVGVEIADFETDREKAWRRWSEPIRAYRNTRLSHTAYALCRARAWDGLRFSEEGPFAWEGWGVDDDEMAYRWNEAGVAVHVATGVHPYRRASGSFRRIAADTGIWANQYGSAYEARLVKLYQDWPQHEPGGAGLGAQWGEPWLTVVVEATDAETTARTVKAAHDLLRERRFEPPWGQVTNPYSVVLWVDGDEGILEWAEPRRWRQHHGDTVIVDGEIVKRDKENDGTWTGDFRVWRGEDWREAVRPGAHYFGLASSSQEVEALVRKYKRLTGQSTRTPLPTARTF
jgi:hypothetical protein